MEVTLPQMLDARERRAAAQQELIRAHGLPLICFTMNIAGPVKDTPPIRRGFEEGCRLLEETLRQNRIAVPEQHKVREATGCEAFYVVRENAQAVKAICARIEDSCPLGRLFDMDVLDEKGGQIRREEVAGGARSCIANGHRSIDDSAGRLEDFYMGQIATGQQNSPESLMEAALAVTPERIMAAAQAVSLDTIYFLTGKEEMDRA